MAEKRTRRSSVEDMGLATYYGHSVSQASENLIKIIADVDEAGASLPAALSPAYLFTTQVSPAYTIPSRTIAQMKVSEYFMNTEADLRQTVEIGMDLGLRRILIQHSDTGVVDEFENLFSDDVLDMNLLAHELWWCLEIYGQAYPTEIWGGKKKQIPLNVSAFDPKYVVVDRVASFSNSVFRLAPNAMAIWQELHQDKMPKEIQSLFSEEIQETPKGAVLTFRKGSITQLRVKEPRFYAYAVPPLTPLFRDLSTRQVLEEMIRSVIEGIKNQLWVFKLENPAPGELAHLKSVISGSSGERTGYLVWKSNLSVEQHVPKMVDDLLANETWMRLTRAIMRGRGISLKVLDGESPDSNIRTDVDVQIFLQRIKYFTSRIRRYLQNFANRYAEKNGILIPPKIDFDHNDLETAAAIKDRVIPLWRAGLSSPQTALEDAGLNYDNELRRKQDAKPHMELFTPTPTFAQTTVNPKTPEKTSMFDPYGGRPPKDGNQKIKAHTLWGSLDEYRMKISEAVQGLQASFGEDKENGVLVFAESLRSINRVFMRRAYEAGYLDAGGQDDVDEDRVMAVVTWNNGYVDNFTQGLLLSETLGNIEQRTGLYATEGQRMAYMYGMFQARREQGYTGWRRVAGEKACTQCRVDSHRIHSINEDFFDFHPGGGCEHSAVSFYRGDTSALPTIIPALPDMPKIGVRKQEEVS